MPFKRRSAAAASPEIKSRAKRRKVSDEDLIDAEISSNASSHVVSDADAEADEASDSQVESEADFVGDSLQTAQDKIMSELTRLQDDDGQQVAYPFIGKPDRNLYRDYYELIQHPVSLRSIQKKVRGTDSRKNFSKTTAYPTWQSFEEEVSYIWQNAREYNEDDSEISSLAGVLEDYFLRRVAEAKKLVPDPLQVDGTPEMPRIKLKMSTVVPPITGKLTLKLPGQNSDTRSKKDAQATNIVDPEPSGPQREMNRAESTGQDTSTSPRARSLRKHLDSPRSSIATTTASEQPTASLGSRGLYASIKKETPVSISTSQTALNVAFDNSADTNHHDDPRPIADPSSAHASLPQNTSSSQFDSILRRPGQDESTALIRNLRVVTHASLSLQLDFCLDIPPSSLVSQQNVTIHLPPSHNILTLRPQLAASTTQRQVKIVALTGMQRLNSSGDVTAPAYDIRLHPGMTKVDLEAIAGPARGVPRSGPLGSDIDYERVTLFLNLLR